WACWACVAFGHADNLRCHSSKVSSSPVSSWRSRSAKQGKVIACRFCRGAKRYVENMRKTFSGQQVAIEHPFAAVHSVIVFTCGQCASKCRFMLIIFFVHGHRRLH